MPPKRGFFPVLLIAGLALAAFSLYRWPPRIGNGATSKGDDFKLDSNPYDVFMGVADYIASSALLVVALRVRFRNAPQGYRLADLFYEKRWGGTLAARATLLSAFYGTIFWCLLAVGAVLAMLKRITS